MPIEGRIDTKSGFEPVGLGLSIPRRATYTFTDVVAGGLPEEAEGVGLGLELVDGVYRIVVISSPLGLTTTILRKLPFDKMLREATKQWWERNLGTPEPVDRVDDETLLALYRLAHAVGLPEVATIAEYYGRPKPTIATWLNDAKNRQALEAVR
jgi:hypothetical protein